MPKLPEKLNTPHIFASSGSSRGAVGPQFGAPGIEINLLYIAALLSLILTGAGTLSIDKWRQRRHG